MKEVYIAMKQSRAQTVYKKSNCLYYFIPFAVLSFYFTLHTILFGAHEASGYYLIHYLYTYRHGFIPRGLVGEILSLFFEKINDNITRSVILLFSCMLIAGASLCIGKALSKSKSHPESFKIIAIIICILCVVPNSFRTYFDDMKLDKALWALSLLAVFLLDTKVGVYFVPIICVAATLINPVFLFCSMLLVSIAMLYCCVDTWSKKWIFLCAISYLAMIVIGLYGAVREKSLGFENEMDMLKYYFSRYDGSISESTLDFMARECMIDYFLPSKEFIAAAYQFYCVEWKNGLSTLFNVVFVSLPAYFGLTVFWIKAIKAETVKSKKLVFFLCMISPLVQIAPILMSWEGSKYFGNNILVQLCLIVFFIVQKNEASISAAAGIVQWAKKNPLISTAILLYAGMFVFAPT